MQNKRAIPIFLVGLLSLASTTPSQADELKRRGMLGVQLAPVNEEVKERLKLTEAKGAIKVFCEVAPL